MGIKSRIKEKIYMHYLKKGMLKSIKEIKDKHKAQEINIPKLLSDIDVIILALKEEVEMFSKAIPIIELKYGKHAEAAEISTIFPFLDLSMLDIFILHKQYLSTKDGMEKNFICRTAAHHMYEFLEDCSKVLGNQMNQLIQNLNDDEINFELKALRKSFNELKKELHIPLKKVRHNVSGHKDRDIRNQLKISNAINIIDFQKNFLLFMIFFFELIKFKKNLTDKIEKRQIAEGNTLDFNPIPKI